MKKLLALFVSVLLVFSAFSSIAIFADDAAGYTYDAETDTYTVTTADGYIAVVNLMNGTSPETANLDATIKLAADLDFTDKVVPALAPAVANGYFSGTFDGNGYTISNVKMEGTTARIALVSNGLACTFVDLTVTNSTFSGAAYSSVLLGDTPKSGDQKLGETVSTSDVVLFENCHLVNCSVTSSANYASLFFTTGDNKVVVKDCSAIDCFVESKQSGGRAAFVGHDRGNNKNIDIINFVATGEAKATSGNGVAGMMGYVCGTTITMTNVYSAIDCGTAKWAGQFVPANRYCNVIISNSICVGAPLGHVYDLGNSGYGDLILTNVAVVAEEGETAPIFGVDVIIASNPDRVALIIDGVVLDGDKDHEPEKDIADAAEAAKVWAAATIPTVNGDAVVAKIRAAFAGNIDMKVAALKAAGFEPTAEDLQGYYYDSLTNTYTVETADALVAVAAIITGDGTKGGGNYNANITLACDIDMNDTDKSWFPICDKSNILYVGTVDGQGHAIKNFNDTSKPTGARRGFIGRAGNCTVKNLTFIDPVVEGGKLTGVIIGDIRLEGNRDALTATDFVTIENCHVVNATVKSTSRENVGGFVGGNSTLAGLVIKNSTISANVTATKYNAGLLIGGEENSAALNYTFENVFATGTLTVSTPNEGKEGSAGLIGGMDGATITMTNVITDVALVGADTNNTITLNNVGGIGFVAENIPALTCDEVLVKIAEIFADNATAKELASASVAHSWAEVIEAKYLVTAASCTAKAVYNKACTVCGGKSEETFEYGEILDHEYIEVLDEKYLATEATCTAKATYYKSCVCGLVSDDTFESGKTLDHTYVEVVAPEYLASAANCTAKATYYKSCSVCGIKGTATFEDGEFAHEFDQEVATSEYLATEATCTAPATYYKSCFCGEKGTETFEDGEALGHAWGQWTVVTEPTTEAEGLKESVCVDCGEKKTEVMPVVVETGIVDQLMAGCGGSIGGASIIIMIAAAGAVVLRKKED